MTQYLSLRQAVRPAVFAHSLMAGNREGAARLTAECDELLQLTRELLRATGHAALLGTESSKEFSHNGSGTPPHSNADHGTAPPSAVRHDSTNPATSPGKVLSTVAENPPHNHLGTIAPNHEISDLTREMPSVGGPASGTTSGGIPGDGAMGDRALREGQLLDAYADAAMAWAKVTGALVALGGTLLETGDWDAVRRLADVLADAGEANLARDLRIRLGATVFGAYRDRLMRIGNAMPPAEIVRSIEVLRAVLRDVPEDFPDRDREVNRLLAPLAASVHKAMKARGIEAGFDSRVEHIATGGVAGYPEIVTTSLDELAAEFEGLYR